MNRKNLELVLNRYVERFDELYAEPHIEWYKWRAINHFQKNWDVDASDFAAMFNNAVKEIKNNLIDSTTNPLSGLLSILKIDKNVEIVREAFKELFVDDGGDLNNRLNRIDRFITKINALILEKYPNSWKYPQDRKAVIWYLNLWNPKDNYIFKSTEAQNMIACMEYADDIGKGMSFSLEKYYKMCDALREEILKNEELLKKHNGHEKIAEADLKDDYHVLVFDVIYCANTYDLYAGMELFTGSAKERIKNALLRELKENIEEKQELLAYLEANKPVFPDLSGYLITHKKFGEGTVKACENEQLQIEFSGETKFITNITTLFKNGIIDLNDEDVKEQIKAIDYWEERKRVTQLEINCLQIEIKKMGK